MTPPFTSLLVANRGEIACRIFRTARAMGMRTIAVYSDADAKAKHVREADEAVHIGASAASESYLRGDKVLAAAKAADATAIHPGYGFLSENPEFAEAVVAAGLIWVGPTPASIRAMGLKDEAKRIAIAAGVPVLSGYQGEDQSEKRLLDEAKAIGFPVLIKAVAGGGGRGIREVKAAKEFKDQLVSAQREAKAAFGDERVLIEKLVERPRHIEVQVFGDKHGGLVHLYERDCSLQRRRQKVIEEAPAPGMTDEVRAAMTEAALKVARAVDYENAGTVEFIVDGNGPLRPDGFWFLEMNTRLQVEHPVTEAVTGLDLVEWQLRVAAGEKLPKPQGDILLDGHAMEARICAEDPAEGFRPSVGRLVHCEWPRFARMERGEADPDDAYWTFVDAGFEEGDTIPSSYDSLLAKLVAFSRTGGAAEAREECRVVVRFWRGSPTMRISPPAPCRRD
ncbi:MAG: mccA [Alphaproteobacteria bacterium]|nr:MAG: mccA [Alphaproteobacteria bacterium]